MKKNDINLFKQLRAFYSKVFELNNKITPYHVSLYIFLLNQNNRANWIEWFKCPADTAMYGALINSNKTYYKVLNELIDFGLIEVKKGVNDFKAAQIKIVKLKYNNELDSEIVEIPIPETNSSVANTPLFTQLPTQVLTQLTTQLTTLLPTLKDKPNTKILITIKQEEIKKKILLSELSDSDVSNSEYLKITKSFHDLFIKNQKSLNVSTDKLEKADGFKWYDTIRLMIDTDKISTTDLRLLYKFISQDHFWKSTCRSVDSLRKNATEMLVKAKTPKKPFKQEEPTRKLEYLDK